MPTIWSTLLTEISERLTFVTYSGSFKWLVILFRLTHTPAAFQQFMNSMFFNLFNIFVIIYLDDILIYSADNIKHTHQVSKVLSWLYKNGLYAKADKCEFHSNTVKFLSYILLPKELTILSDKVYTIMDWLESHWVKDI